MKIRGGDWGDQFRWTFSDPECRRVLEQQQQRMRSLRVAYDNDGLWDWGGPDQCPAMFGQMVDQYVGAGAAFIAWGVGGNQAWNSRPTVMEAAWKAAPGRKAWSIPHWDYMGEFAARDTDPLDILLGKSAASGLPVLANFRLNRYHPGRGIADGWFLDNPQFHLSAESAPWTQMDPPRPHAAINLAHGQVQEHLARQLLDVVENYPVDGLQLEVLRAIPLFELAEPEKAAHMNRFLGLLRQGLDRIGRQRGKRLELALMLPTQQHHSQLRFYWPARFLDQENWGLDPVAWIEDELVDILMPCIYSQDLNAPKPAPLPTWLEQARQSKVQVYGTVMMISTMVEDGVTSCAGTVDILRSISDGCDGVFLFNSQPIHLAAVLDAAPRSPGSGRPAAEALYPIRSAEGRLENPPGALFLKPEEVYEFRALPAERIAVAPPPAGKPYLIRMDNGELLTAYTRNYVADLPRAQKMEFYTEIRWSGDDGATWSEPVRPYPPEVVPSCKEGTLVPLASGTVMCLTHGRKGEDHYLTPMITLSEDFGRTWCRPWKLDVSAMFPTGHALSNRSHIPRADGSVILFFTDFSVQPIETWACISRDQGRTHDECWLVGPHIGDQSFVQLPSGRQLAAVRIYGEDVADKSTLAYGYDPDRATGLARGEAHDYIAITESDDDGRTWSAYRPLTRYGEGPSQLLVLDNGWVLLTHGVRSYPMGAQAIISRDEGATWDLEHRYMLASHGAPYCGSLPDWGHPYPNGHPYSVQRSDGRILTLYYRTLNPAVYDSTVIEGVVWDLPADAS